MRCYVICRYSVRIICLLTQTKYQTVSLTKGNIYIMLHTHIQTTWFASDLNEMQKRFNMTQDDIFSIFLSHQLINTEICTNYCNSNFQNQHGLAGCPILHGWIYAMHPNWTSQNYSYPLWHNPLTTFCMEVHRFPSSYIIHNPKRSQYC